MDGTLAEFKNVETLEILYEKDYFFNLKPQINVVEAVKDIIKKGEVEVFILSAVLSDSKYALDEKNKWLDKFIPEIDKEHRIFPPCGADKKDYLPNGIRKDDYLLDDYTHNLILWSPPAEGIKLLNDINHTRGTWQGNCINYNKSSEELSNNIYNIMISEILIRDKKSSYRNTQKMSDERKSLKDIKNEINDYKNGNSYIKSESNTKREDKEQR